MGVTTWKVRNQAAIKKKKAEQAKWLKKIRGAVETCAKGRSKSVRRRRSVGDKQVWIIGVDDGRASLADSCTPTVGAHNR